MNSTRRERVSQAGRTAVARPNVIERGMSKFLREPPSVRTAAGVIVTATLSVVVVSGVLMRVVDHSQYRNIWVGMWWALQTVTTVGYGDVTPTKPIARILASFVMLEGIALLAIITAAVTSTFVARAQAERGLEEDAEFDQLRSQYGDLAERLGRIERTLGRLAGPDPD
jgi:voltage-gated potassium channel